MNLRKLVGAFVIPFALLLSQQSTALTQAEYEAQIKAYEKQLKKLEKQAKRNKKRNRKINRSIGNYDSRFRINGFFSAGLAKSDNDALFSAGGVTSDASFKADGVFGLQMLFNFTEKVSATTQLVTVFGATDNTNVEWGYLSYEYSPSLTLRAGRLRLPYYLLSEFLDVGYAYPWVRPPEEVYNVPISSYEGMDFLYRFEMFGWDALWQTGVGGPVKRDAQFGVDFKLEDNLVHALEISRGPWTLRTGYSQGKLEITTFDGTPQTTLDAVNGAREEFQLNLLSDGDRADYLSFGMRYDDSNWLVLLEVTRLRSLEGPLGSRDSHYITVAKRLGNFMPYTGWNRTRPSGSTTERAEKDLAIIEGGRAATQEIVDGLGALNANLSSLVAILAAEEEGASLPIVVNGTPISDSATVINLIVSEVTKDGEDNLSDTSRALLDTLRGNPDSFDIQLLQGQLSSGAAEASAALAPGGTFDQLAEFVFASRSGVVGQKSWVIGGRYDITHKVSMKLEYQRFYDMINGGIFSTNTEPDDSVNMYSFVVDAVW